jgi:hypothetical protein
MQYLSSEGGRTGVLPGGWSGAGGDVPRQEGELVLDDAFEGLGDVDVEVAVGVEADFAARGPAGMAPRELVSVR